MFIKQKQKVNLVLSFDFVLISQQIKLLKSKSDALTQKVDQQHGSIVQESTTRESAFASKISDLQLEIKQIKKSEKNVKQECELTKQHYLELQKKHEV